MTPPEERAKEVAMAVFGIVRPPGRGWRGAIHMRCQGTAYGTRCMAPSVWYLPGPSRIWQTCEEHVGALIAEVREIA